MMPRAVREITRGMMIPGGMLPIRNFLFRAQADGCGAGDDEKLMEKMEAAAKDLKPDLLALVGSPVPW